MSRIFNALHEAARRRGQVETAESIWAELGINPASLPEEDKRAKVASQRGAIANGTVAQVEEELHVPEVLAPAAPVVDPLEWTSTHAALDKQARLIPHTADTIVLERYRMLRNKILLERDRKFFRSLVITSASPREGKTVTVINLGLTFATLSSMRVLVVDGDLRRGTLGSWMGIDPQRPGLSNLLDGSAGINDVLMKADDFSLYVLPSGNARIGDLEQSRFDAAFKPLTKHFDLILVDSPPVNLISDVQTIAGACDAVLLLARAFTTTTKSLEEAAEKLQTFRIIGTILNAGSPARSRKYKGYY